MNLKEKISNLEIGKSVRELLTRSFGRREVLLNERRMVHRVLNNSSPACAAAYSATQIHENELKKALQNCPEDKELIAQIKEQLDSANEAFRMIVANDLKRIKESR